MCVCVCACVCACVSMRDCIIINVATSVVCCSVQRAADSECGGV